MRQRTGDLDRKRIIEILLPPVIVFLVNSAKGSRSMNLYMNHVSAEMIREERNQILDAQQSDIRALADVLQALLDAHELCVIGSEEKIEEQKEMFLEIKTL